MQFTKIWAGIGLCVALSGCQLAFDATENVVFETCLSTNAITSIIYHRFLAQSAWSNYCADHLDNAGSGDFACGFKKGYSDFLEYGDCCTQRCVPPMRYWKVRNETPEGRMAAKLWQDGFREGKTAAEASGLRQFIPVPLAEPGTKGPPPAPPPVVHTLPPSPVPAGSSVLPGPPMKRPSVPPPPPPSATPSRPAPELPAPRFLPAYESRKPLEGAKEITKLAVVPTATHMEARSKETIAAPRLDMKSKEIASAVPRRRTPSPLRFSASVTRSANDACVTPASLAFGVGMAAMQGGNREVGLCWLQSALKEDPNYAPAHRALMEYYQQVGDLFQAAVHQASAEISTP